MTRQGLSSGNGRRVGWVMMMHLCRMRLRAGGKFLVGFLLRVAHSYVEIKRLKGIWWMPWH
jgi:hypothetical protein